MSGVSGRSGGKNRKFKVPANQGDGCPVSPRQLSPRADELFQWLTDKLGADNADSGWKRVDGAFIASMAELVESQESVSALLVDDPQNLEAIRLRNVLASQIVRMSGIAGLTPFDRSRHPKPTSEPAVDDPFQKIMDRMRRG